MGEHASSENHSGRQLTGLIAWLWVLAPFLYGVWALLLSAVPLFSG